MFIILLNAVLPIILGGIIYISWRKESLYMFHWFNGLGLNGIILALRDFLLPAKNYLPAFILYSLPDALWVYSLTFVMIWIWRDGPKAKLLFWGSIGPILGIGGEIGQFFGVVIGTFDIVDLLLCSVSVCVAILLIKGTEIKNAK